MWYMDTQLAPLTRLGRVMRCAYPGSATEQDIDILLTKLSIREMVSVICIEETRLGTLTLYITPLCIYNETEKGGLKGGRGAPDGR